MTETRFKEVQESGERGDRLDLILARTEGIERRLEEIERRLERSESLHDESLQEMGVIRDDIRYGLLGDMEHLAEELRRRRAGLRVRAYAEGRPDLLPPGDGCECRPAAPAQPGEGF